MIEWLTGQWTWLSGIVIATAIAWLSRQRLSDWRRSFQDFKRTYRDVSAIKRQLEDCIYHRERAERDVEMTRKQADRLADAMESLMRQGEAAKKILDKVEIVSSDESD